MRDCYDVLSQQQAQKQQNSHSQGDQGLLAGIERWQYNTPLTIWFCHTAYTIVIYRSNLSVDVAIGLTTKYILSACY